MSRFTNQSLKTFFVQISSLKSVIFFPPATHSRYFTVGISVVLGCASQDEIRSELRHTGLNPAVHMNQQLTGQSNWTKEQVSMVVPEIMDKQTVLWTLWEEPVTIF